MVPLASLPGAERVVPGGPQHDRPVDVHRLDLLGAQHGAVRKTDFREGRGPPGIPVEPAPDKNTALLLTLSDEDLQIPPTGSEPKVRRADPLPELQDVRPLIVEYPIVPVATVPHVNVVALAAMQPIVPCSTVQDIIPCAGLQIIRTTTAVQNIVPRTSIEIVVPQPPLDDRRIVGIARKMVVLIRAQMRLQHRLQVLGRQDRTVLKLHLDVDRLFIGGIEIGKNPRPVPDQYGLPRLAHDQPDGVAPGDDEG